MRRRDSGSVVSYNPGYQSVLKDLEATSTRQRMVAIEFGFPLPRSRRASWCTSQASTQQRLMSLVRFGQAIRRLETGGLREVASTRVLIAAGRLIAEGLTSRDAARAAIAGPLTDDASVGRGLSEMIEVYLVTPTSLDGLTLLSVAASCLNKYWSRLQRGADVLRKHR